MMPTVAVDEYYLSEQDEATVLWRLGPLEAPPERMAPLAPVAVPASVTPARVAVRAQPHSSNCDRRLPLVA